jgi:hypothetical protein
VSDFFDKAKDLLAEHSDTVDDVVDKIAGVVDDTTGGKHKEQVKQGKAKAKEAIAGLVEDAPRNKKAKTTPPAAAPEPEPEPKPKPRPA